MLQSDQQRYTERRFGNHMETLAGSKCCCSLISVVLLQHCNTRPHTACARAQQITNLRLDCLPHLTCSPDLSLYDYYVFGPLKETMREKWFGKNDETKEAVRGWFHAGLVRRFFFCLRKSDLSEKVAHMH